MLHAGCRRPSWSGNRLLMQPSELSCSAKPRSRQARTWMLCPDSCTPAAHTIEFAELGQWLLARPSCKLLSAVGAVALRSDLCCGCAAGQLRADADEHAGGVHQGQAGGHGPPAALQPPGCSCRCCASACSSITTGVCPRSLALHCRRKQSAACLLRVDPAPYECVPRPSRAPWRACCYPIVRLLQLPHSRCARVFVTTKTCHIEQLPCMPSKCTLRPNKMPFPEHINSSARLQKPPLPLSLRPPLSR